VEESSVGADTGKAGALGRVKAAAAIDAINKTATNAPAAQFRMWPPGNATS
jgi:hypothetical protein